MQKAFIFYCIISLSFYYANAQSSKQTTRKVDEKPAIDYNMHREQLSSKTKQKSALFSKHRTSKFEAYLQKMQVAYSVFFHYSPVNTEILLNLEGDAAYIDGEYAADYSSSPHSSQGYENHLYYADREAYWRSNEVPSQYTIQELNSKRDFVGGFVVEFRSLNTRRGDSPRGYYFSTGVLLMTAPLPEFRDHQKHTVLFPIGMGFLVPGDVRFHVEIGASALVGFQGFSGGKFDFLFNTKTFKVGPVFTFAQTGTDFVKNEFGAIGIQFGFIPSMFSGQGYSSRGKTRKSYGRAW